MAVSAENGAVQLNRQDFAGYSFLGRKSNYQLAGPPGWINDTNVAKSSLTPHPDWCVTYTKLVAMHPGSKHTVYFV